MATTLWEIVSRFANLFIWWTIVSPWESGIRVRLGSRVTKIGPGIHLRIPYFDAIFKQTVRRRITIVQLQTLSTQDRKTVTVCATVGYAIADIALLYNTLHHADETIRNMVAGAIARTIQSMTSDECLPQDVERQVNAVVDLSGFGLAGTEIRLVDFAFVRTFRFLQDQRWGSVGDLDTCSEKG